jgi:two-component system, chemotaxis family, response regulator Rcp1
MPIDVLLVDDNLGDVRLTKEAIREACPSLRLTVARDGVEAVAFLRDIYHPLPDLVLLDLNLPRATGLEVLAFIKSDARLRVIPTIILTSSDADVDVEKSYRLGANCYLRKPKEWDAFADLMTTVINFWLTKAKLPGTKTETCDEIPIQVFQTI